jgi:hypothetical protein
MAYHTARLIITIIFLIFAVSSLVTRYWFSALFWALLTAAVGYPFVRGGKLDLYFDGEAKRASGTPTVETVYVTAAAPVAAAI